MGIYENDNSYLIKSMSVEGVILPSKSIQRKSTFKNGYDALNNTLDRAVDV